MSATRNILTLSLVLLTAATAILFALKTQGYFDDPKKALRALKAREIPPTQSSVIAASTQGDLDALELLKRAGVDLHIQDSRGQTPLLLAAAHQKTALFPLLLAEDFDLNQADQAGHTPLFWALAHQDFELADQLIAQGAEIDFLHPSGELALVEYYQSHQQENFQYLLKNGANANSFTQSGINLFELSLSENQPEIACQLLGQGRNANDPVYGEPPLISVLKNYQRWQLSTEALRQIIGTLLVSGSNIEQVSSQGLTPLQLALKNNIATTFDLLFPRTENVDNCLWYAIRNQNLKAIDTLLRKGANPNQTAQNQTPLEHALANKQQSLLEVLLKYGANPNTVTLSGQRLLFDALARRNTDAALALLKTPQTTDFNTPMDSPVSEDFRDLFGRAGLFDWYCRNETGLTPLMVAVMQGELSVAERLIELGSDRFQGTTAPGVVFPIQMAAKRGDIKMQQLLLGVSYNEDDQERHFIIDLSEQKVRYYKHGKLTKTSRISTGRKGYRTPTGEYVITDKTKDKKSNIYDEAPMPYFQRFSCKAIGFHEGYTGSRFASHGCIRLPRSVAQFFWKETSLGDRVTIQD